MELYIRNCYHDNGESMSVEYKATKEDIPDLIDFLEIIKSKAISINNKE